MASEDKRPVFPGTENSSGNGVPLGAAQEGAVAAGLDAQGALVGKDPSGNLQYLALNVNNEIIISGGGVGVACLNAHAKIDGNLALTPIATIVLQLAMTYKQIGYIVSSTRSSEFEIVYIDDVGVTDVETVLARVITGIGDSNDSSQLECLEFDTIGGTGVQNLVIRGKNHFKTSDMNATLTVREE